MRFDMNRPGKGHRRALRGAFEVGDTGRDHGFGGRFGHHFGQRFAGDFEEGFGGGFGRGRGFGGGDGRRGPGGFGGGRGGPGGRGRRMFAAGELRLLLLDLLGEADRHGYELIKAIEDLTGGNYAPSPGVVYPTLALLVDEELIREVPGEGARKAFTQTDAGKAEAITNAERVAAIKVRLQGLADASAREASPPVMRAMTNLKLALRGRVGAAGFDIDTAHQIADILDEAARKIERL